MAAPALDYFCQPGLSCAGLNPSLTCGYLPTEDKHVNEGNPIALRRRSFNPSAGSAGQRPGTLEQDSYSTYLPNEDTAGTRPFAIAAEATVEVPGMPASFVRTRANGGLLQSRHKPD